jgi:hypothetical protein
MSGVETPQDKGVKDDFSIHVLKDVAISSALSAVLRMTTRLRFPFSGVSWTIPRHKHATQQKSAPRGIGGCVRREASIEGVRFRCRLQAVSRFYPFLTHRNLRHAGWRLKRAFRFRKVLWLLSSKESNNKNNPCPNTALCLRHRVARDAPVLCLGLKPRRIRESKMTFQSTS